MVANDVSQPDAGFEVDTNRAVLLDAGGGIEHAAVARQDPSSRGSSSIRSPACWTRSARSQSTRAKQHEQHTFTSESVTEGHPDKMADQISDTVLDAVLDQDPYSRVACETLCTTGLVVVAGEITTKAHIDFPRIVRDTIRSIGYTDAAYGIDGKTCGVIISIDEQSPDIAMGVDKAMEIRDGRERPLRRGRRRRPGDDVRLRVRRHRRPHADADLARAPPGHAAHRGAQGRHRSTSCGPTARPRCRSSTRTVGRWRCRPC